MSLLHTVNKSPFSHSTLASCLTVIQPGDALLLIEDGVYANLPNPLIEQLSTCKTTGVALFVLIEDVTARGINDKQNGLFTAIDYHQFVTLSTQHHSVQSWY